MSSDPRDRSSPSGLDETVAAPAAAAAAAVAPDAASADTMMAPPGARATTTPPTMPAPMNMPAATSATVAADSDLRTRSGTSSSATTGAGPGRSTVGNELRGASVERFTQVGRDRFELLDELARGGLGRVFRARDPRTGRIVAIKEVLRPRADIILRFAREALVTANLQHPSIVPVYEVGRWPGGEPFIAMKLVEGRTLEALIHEAGTTEQRVALLAHVVDVADALAYAHAEHVIHRDLKPANVLVGAYGETVVIDWGLAKNVATGEELEALPTASTLPPEQGETVAGAVIGTPAYMAPEQALGDKLDERADVYAIGAILYHALAGVRPYVEAISVGDLIQMVANQPPRPLGELAPDLPAELLAIVEKAMARDPSMRYPSARELAADLRRFQAGQIVGAHRYTTWQLVRRWIGRHRALVLTAAVALAAVAVIGALAVRGIAKERDEANRQRAAAHEARGLAERRFADSLEELARQALLASGADRALPLLAGAVDARGEMSPAAGVLAARALAVFDGLAAIAPGQPGGATTGFVAGGRLISADRSGSVRAWDIAARRDAWSARGAVRIARSPTGAYVLGADVAGAVRVWSAADGTLVGSWAMPADATGEPVALTWGEGDRFAIASGQGHVAVGAVGDATLHVGEPHRGPAWGLAFSPGGALLATAGADGVTTLRDARTAAISARLADADTAELAAVVWIDAQRIATGDARGVARIWDTATRRLERRVRHPADIYGLAAGGGAHPWLATFGHGAVVVVWDASTGAALARLEGHVHGTDMAATWGDLLVTTDEAGNAHAWNPRTGRRVLTFPNEGPINELWASADDGLVLLGEARLRVWSRAGAGVRAWPGHTARVRALEWSTDSHWLYSASHDGTARGVEVATGATVVLGEPGRFEEPELQGLPRGPMPTNPLGVRSLALAPDGATVVTANEDGTLALWDARTTAAAPRAIWRGHTGRVRHVTFSTDGRTAFSVGDTTLRRWDVATGKETARTTLPGPGWEVELVDNDRVLVVLTEDQHLLMTSAADFAPIAAPADLHTPPTLVTTGTNIAFVTETRTAVLDAAGKPIAETPYLAASAAALGPPSAPRWLVLGSKVGDAALFTWPALAPVRTWRANDAVTAIAFRPDGAIVATIGLRTLRLWDPATGRLLSEIDAGFLLTQLGWSPDGRWLAIAGASGTVLTFDLAPPPAATLTSVAACASTWELADAVLVARPFDPARCDDHGTQ